VRTPAWLQNNSSLELGDDHRLTKTLTVCRQQRRDATSSITALPTKQRSSAHAPVSLSVLMTIFHKALLTCHPHSYSRSNPAEDPNRLRPTDPNSLGLFLQCTSLLRTMCLVIRLHSVTRQSGPKRTKRISQPVRFISGDLIWQIVTLVPACTDILKKNRSGMGRQGATDAHILQPHNPSTILNLTFAKLSKAVNISRSRRG
jgi:hypothetical protein